MDKPGYNDFESGDDDSYNLPLPSGIQLTTDDILWLRLQLRGNDTWKPETIELLVNGSVVMHVGVRGLALDSNNWYWVQASFPQTRNYTREAQFAHSLRAMNGNDFHNSITPSTPSWVQGLPLICATGQVDGVFPYPYGGTIDGFVPLWLLVESVQIGDRTYMLNEAQGFYQPRYLMVTWRPSDFPAPRFTQRIRVCGDVQWNRERVGEYILIPRNRTDTTFPGE